MKKTAVIFFRVRLLLGFFAVPSSVNKREIGRQAVRGSGGGRALLPGYWTRKRFRAACEIIFESDENWKGGETGQARGRRQLVNKKWAAGLDGNQFLRRIWVEAGGGQTETFFHEVRMVGREKALPATAFKFAEGPQRKFPFEAKNLNRFS